VMNASDAYHWLIQASAASRADSFDIHVVASIFALALDETEAEQRTLCEGIGLDGSEFADVADAFFPAAAPTLQGLGRHVALEIGEEERNLRDLLLIYAACEVPLARAYTAMVARRCARPHHLWQDLGLRNRTELTQFMRRKFPTLAEKNRQDMKWKKFLYRLICQSEGFSFCTAPVCTECEDFLNCFGVEDGEGLLARARNARPALPVSI
jgi:nitrogen fixation protein NifQ